MLSQRQEAELVTAIQGRGEIPLKFVYLGKGAFNWNKLALQRVQSGGINSVEARLLEKRVEGFIATLTPGHKVNVIDVGCGNGGAVLPVLRYLTQEAHPFSYVPFDISKEMLDLAVATVESQLPGTLCRTLQLDFETSQFGDVFYALKDDGSTNLIVFLGSTLGNQSDLHRILTNFRDSMTSKDFIIIGVELTNLAKTRTILREYGGEIYFNTVSFILDYLGVPRQAYRHEVAWNSIESQVETVAVFLEDFQLEIGGEKVTLKKGETILLMRSKKFTEPSISELLSDVGFRHELLTTSQDRGYLLTMVQPTRYSL